MKKIIIWILTISIVLMLFGCKKKEVSELNEYQQQFVVSVEVVERVSDKNFLDAIKTAFSKYMTLTEKDSQEKTIEEAKNTLFDIFNSKVNSLSEEEMSVALDVKISELEEIVSGFPESLSSSLSGCEKLKEIRSKHFQWYVDQSSVLADKIEEISKKFDDLYLEETVALINETLPLYEEIQNLSYQKEMEKIKKDYEIVSPAEGIELLENVKGLIPQMCYENTYVVKFEYLEDYPKDSVESGTDYYLYGYKTSASVGKYLKEYKQYLDQHFELISSDNATQKFIYDIGEGKQFEISDYSIPSWSIYAVMVVIRL